MSLKISGRLSDPILRTVYHRGFAVFVTAAAGLSFGLSIYIMQTIPHAEDNKLRVNFLDIGQGDSILIQAPNGNSMMIDSGPVGGKVLTESAKLKNFFDKSIDVTLMTHGDADHIGSMIDIFKKYSVSMFVNPGVDAGTKLYENLIEYSAAKIPQNLIAMAGVKIVLDESRGVHFKILSPNFMFQIDRYDECRKSERQKFFQAVALKVQLPKSGKSKYAKNAKQTKSKCEKMLQLETNQNSIVGELVYGSTTFMLTGDAPVETEKYLIENSAHESARQSIRENSARQKSDTAKTSQDIFSQKFFMGTTNVLKLGHHGSKTSTSEEFLNFINPKFAVISVGAMNRYGHPNEETMKRLKKYSDGKAYAGTSDVAGETRLEKMQILRTDEMGTVSLVSDGGRVWVGAR